MSWINNGFIDKGLYTPFTLENDRDYYNDLKYRLKFVYSQAKKAGADEECLKIIQNFKKKILKAIDCYYQSDIAKCNNIIKNLVKSLSKDSLALSTLNESYAYPGLQERGLQFFRCRIGDPSKSYSPKEMLHLPASLRAKSGNYRFSIPGNPSFYLSNSSYGCWIETGFPPDNVFNVSPVQVDGKLKIFNLAVYIRDSHYLNNYEEQRVHCWLGLLMLSIATSYRIKEEGRTFKSEYIISQSLMMACKNLGYDGIAYYSKRVYDDVFARCAVNLVLFVTYNGEYSKLVQSLKIDDSLNYDLFSKMHTDTTKIDFALRVESIPTPVNIGTYDRQKSYSDTRFSDFDKYLFKTWKEKPNGRGMDSLPWGIECD